MKTVAVALVIALTGPVAAAGLLPSGVPGASGGPWGAWAVQTLDLQTNPLFKQYVAMDSSGRLHTYFKKFDPTLVVHGVLDGVSWHTHTLSARGRAAGMGVDEDGGIHLLRYDGPNLHYHRLTGATPTDEIVDTNGPEHWDLAVDDGGRAHAAYAPPSGQLWYAGRSTSGTWTKELVATNVLEDVEIAVDALGRVHIVYVPFTFDDTRYLLRSATGQWTNEEVPGCIAFVDIAVDAAGNPHVSCWAFDGLRYAKRVNGAWQRELVENGASNGYEASMTLDPSGTPHIAYMTRVPAFPDDPVNHARPKYATKTAVGWTVETVDQDGLLNGFAPAVDTDASGRPFVTYVLGRRAESLNAVDVGGPINPYTDLRLARPLTTLLTPAGT